MPQQPLGCVAAPGLRISWSERSPKSKHQPLLNDAHQHADLGHLGPFLFRDHTADPQSSALLRGDNSILLLQLLR